MFVTPTRCAPEPAPSWSWSLHRHCHRGHLCRGAWPRLIPSLPLWGRAEAPRPDMTRLQSSEYAPTPGHHTARPRPALGPDERAGHADPPAAVSRDLGGPDRVRLRRRHLARATRGRVCAPVDLRRRRGAVSPVLARRPLDRLHGPLQREPPGLRDQRRRRHAAAAHLLQRRRRLPPRGGIDNRVLGWTPDGKRILFLAHRLPWSDRIARPHLVAGSRRHGERRCRCPKARAAGSRPTASGSSTRRSSASSAPGSATAAAARRTSGSTTSPQTRPSRSPTTPAPTTSRCGSATPSTSPPTAARTSKLNLWAYDLRTRTQRQVTTHDRYDVLWPSGGPAGVVYENGGYVYRFDPAEPAEHARRHPRRRRPPQDAPVLPKGEERDPVDGALADRRARALRGPRRRLHACRRRKARSAT